MNNKHMGCIEVCWNPSKKGWVKLNMDGVANSEGQPVGCDGLLRNEDGKWICGFAKPLNNCSSFISKC